MDNICIKEKENVYCAIKENSFRSKKEIKDYLQNKNASKIIDSLRDEDRVLYNGKAKKMGGCLISFQFVY